MTENEILNMSDPWDTLPSIRGLCEKCRSVPCECPKSAMTPRTQQSEQAAGTPVKLTRPIDTPHEFVPEFQGTSACKVCGQSISAKEHAAGTDGRTPRTLKAWRFPTAGSMSFDDDRFKESAQIETELTAALRRVTELEAQARESKPVLLSELKKMISDAQSERDAALRELDEAIKNWEAMEREWDRALKDRDKANQKTEDMRKDRDELRQRLSAESARIDWLESGGILRQSEGGFYAAMSGSTAHDERTVREAIDSALPADSQQPARP